MCRLPLRRYVHHLRSISKYLYGIRIDPITHGAAEISCLWRVGDRVLSSGRIWAELGNPEMVAGVSDGIIVWLELTSAASYVVFGISAARIKSALLSASSQRVNVRDRLVAGRIVGISAEELESSSIAA